MRLLTIDPQVVVLAAGLTDPYVRDPADRLIVGTALHLHAPLVTKDDRIRRAKLLETIW